MCTCTSVACNFLCFSFLILQLGSLECLTFRGLLSRELNTHQNPGSKGFLSFWGNWETWEHWSALLSPAAPHGNLAPLASSRELSLVLSSLQTLLGLCGGLGGRSSTGAPFPLPAARPVLLVRWQGTDLVPLRLCHHHHCGGDRLGWCGQLMEEVTAVVPLRGWEKPFLLFSPWLCRMEGLWGGDGWLSFCMDFRPPGHSLVASLILTRQRAHFLCQYRYLLL